MQVLHLFLTWCKLLVMADSLPGRMTVSAFAGMGAATVCHPIDVVRVQMQLFERRGTVDALRSIVGNGGVVALYDGLSAAYLRQWTYGSCRLGIFSFLVERWRQQQATMMESGGTQPVPLGVKLWFGALSGGIGALAGNPAELALVRMSADRRMPVDMRKNYASVFDCLRKTVREVSPAHAVRSRFSRSDR